MAILRDSSTVNGSLNVTGDILWGGAKIIKLLYNS